MGDRLEPSFLFKQLLKKKHATVLEDAELEPLSGLFGFILVFLEGGGCIGWYWWLKN